MDRFFFSPVFVSVSLSVVSFLGCVVGLTSSKPRISDMVYLSSGAVAVFGSGFVVFGSLGFRGFLSADPVVTSGKERVGNFVVVSKDGHVVGTLHGSDGDA